MFKRLVLTLALGLAGVHAWPHPSGGAKQCCRKCLDNYGQYASCSSCVPLQEDINAAAGKGHCKGCGSGYYKADCTTGTSPWCFCTTLENGLFGVPGTCKERC